MGEPLYASPPPPPPSPCSTWKRGIGAARSLPRCHCIHPPCRRHNTAETARPRNPETHPVPSRCSHCPSCDGQQSQHRMSGLMMAMRIARACNLCVKKHAIESPSCLERYHARPVFLPQASSQLCEIHQQIPKIPFRFLARHSAWITTNGRAPEQQ